ncbi:MAG TPA: SRPBCC domain-containing protein [Candidatus Saccharimonadales bacterium]
MQNDGKSEFLVTRVFDAPCELVWNAWTTPDLIAKWFAPGIVMDVREFDVRPGGHFRFADPNDENSGEYTGKYITVNPLQELSFSVMDYSEDSSGVEAGFKVVFEELGTQTKIILTSITPPSLDALDARSEGAQEAWNGCFDRLEKVIQ